MSLAVKVARAGSQGGIGAGRRVTSGDPGLLGFLKGAARTAVGFATGGPGGALTAFQQSIRPGRPAAPRGAIPFGPTGTFAQPSAPIRAAQRFVPGGKTGEEMVKLACPKGYRPNKSDYFLTDGTFVAAGSKCVKYRRRNPMNARALSNAITRINGGKRFQNTLSEISTGKFTAAGKHKAHH
ncbi:MAG: hypothetical protein BMS9Abin29_2508 [Gemmatimonadota bacterium]|nr:MAG: hypothetical protein BMS9Abin29_2508 [Gemmatimonadota bacterium]